MSEEDIRNAVVKFDREDLLAGNYEIDIDTPVEVFITIKQMSKFIKQQEEIQWYEKENKYNQEIIIKQEQELQQKENIIKEVREYNESILKERWYGGNEKEYAKHNLEILGRENNEKCKRDV